MCVLDQANDVYVILYPCPFAERNVARPEVDFVEPRRKITDVFASSSSKFQDAFLRIKSEESASRVSLDPV